MTNEQRYLRTSDLAQAGGISVQQVRNYEASGFLSPAERSSGGYRLYTQQHLAALQAVRRLARGYGWQRTRAIMQAVYQGNLPLALATIDEHHAELARKRLQIEQILAALNTLNTPAAPLSASPRPRLFRVGEAANQAGVRVSALYFWEQQGLLQPVREKSSHYRLYDEQQMRRLSVVVLLREAGYNFPVIQAVLDELAAGQPEKAIAAIEKRREELARMSWACVEVIPAFQAYIHTFQEKLLAAL